jgi:hypothetical protein
VCIHRNVYLWTFPQIIVTVHQIRWSGRPQRRLIIRSPKMLRKAYWLYGLLNHFILLITQTTEKVARTGTFCTLIWLYPQENECRFSYRTDSTPCFSKCYVTAHCVTVWDYLPTHTRYFEYLRDHLSCLVYKRRQNWIDFTTLYCFTKPVTEL